MAPLPLNIASNTRVAQFLLEQVHQTRVSTTPTCHWACLEMLQKRNAPGRTPLEKYVQLWGYRHRRLVIQSLESCSKMPLAVPVSSIDPVEETKMRKIKSAGTSVMVNPSFNEFQRLVANEMFRLLEQLDIREVAYSRSWDI